MVQIVLEIVPKTVPKIVAVELSKSNGSTIVVANKGSIANGPAIAVSSVPLVFAGEGLQAWLIPLASHERQS